MNEMQVLANGFSAGAIYSLVALGFAIKFIPSRFFDFSYAATLLLAAVMTYWSYEYMHFPIVASVSIGGITGMAFSLGAELLVFTPLRKRHSTDLVLIIASLGVLIVMTNSIALALGDSHRTISGCFGTISLGTVNLGLVQVSTIFIALGTCACCWISLVKSAWGIRTRAVANNPDLASSVGIRVGRIIYEASAIGGAVGGLGAALFTLDMGLSPSLGFQLLLPGIVAAVIGGSGTIVGAIVGGFLVGIVQHLSGWVISSGWQDGMFFVILIFFLMFRPSGLFGKPASAARI